MVKWTEGAVADDEPVERPSLSRRLRSTVEQHSGSLGSALGIARGGVAIGVVVTIVAATMSFGNRSAEIVSAVKAPIFAKLPTVVAAPRPTPAEEPPAPPAPPVRLSPFSPVIDYVQRFSERVTDSADVCRALAALGFSRARWAASEVFRGEWECASALVVDEPTGGSAFVVVRGPGRAATRSVMLKLSPPSAEERGVFIAKAKGVMEAARVLATPQVHRDLDEWKTGDFPVSNGRIRLIPEYGQGERRVVSLTFALPLPRPGTDHCSRDCRRWFAALIAAPEKRTTKLVER